MNKITQKTLTKDGVLLQQVISLESGEQFQHKYEYDDFGLVQIITSELRNDHWIPIVMIEYKWNSGKILEVYSEYIEGKWLVLNEVKKV